MLTNCLRFFIVPICLVVILPLMPTIALSQSTTETWFGWIESPEQQLRTIVRVQRDQTGKATAGFIVSPDQTPESIKLTQFQIDPNGTWRFTVENPIDAKHTATFSGKQSSASEVAGDLEQAGGKLSLAMRKIDSLPTETRSNLGADAVWLGTLDLVVRKMDFRIRVYSKSPFATPEAPRLLFDSLTQNAVGIPTQVSLVGNGTSTFEMKSVGAKYVAKLNEAANELDGRFIQGPLPLPLLMKLQSEKTTEADVVDSNTTMRPSSNAKTLGKAKALADGSPLILDGEITAPVANQAKSSSAFYEETSFEVIYGLVKPRKAREPTSAERGITLSGTVTIPKLKHSSQPRKFPAVVMVTGSGPQDRDETIGRHKPFEAIAHYLAENGIASLRYDDRGVGKSTGDFLNATSEDFAKDAIEVWKHARSIPEIDGSKIGILGHSEGGLVGPVAAVWEPGIAFLILLAPPGLTGSEILKSQIDHISELQGMSESDRKATMALQVNLQDIASGYFRDETTMQRDIRNAIRENWDSLKSIAKSQDPKADLDQVKTDLTNQIEGQFQQLRMPWYRFFLNYDPTPNWMLLRCPTLAIWGSNDVQVLPQLNLAKIQRAIDRNQSLDSQLTILPGLNHLFQTSKSGLPDEYNEIEETISPTALSTIRKWAEAQGIIER